MSYYVLVPEAPGRFGSETVFIDERARPPVLEKLNIEFDGWLGDALVEEICCYLVTEVLRDRILTLNPSGVTFGEAKATRSKEFEERDPMRALPPFAWLQVTGIAAQDDFGYTKSNGCSLVVSSRILEILTDVGISHCAVVPFKKWRGARAAILEKIRKFELDQPLPKG